jgi:hypothetical protein
MTLFHAVVWLDHHQAEILQFDPEHVQASKVKASTSHTRTHGNGLKDFQHHVDKHRPGLAPHIFGYEAVDHPSPAQLVALARRFFLKADRMAGTPTPS